MSFALTLQGSGLLPGERLAIYAQSCPEWHIVDFACYLSRLIVVPIYPTLTSSHVQRLLAHSGCAAVFAGDQAERSTIEALRASLPDLRLMFSQDGVRAQAISAEQEQNLRAHGGKTQASDVATIIYTSGTTGDPKGVMLTHANLLFNVRAGIQRMNVGVVVSDVLSVLPLSHVFERMLCYSYFARGCHIIYGDPYKAAKLLQRYRPEVMAVVPRILEKVHEAVDKQIAEMPAWKRRLCRRLLGAAHEDARAGRRSFARTLADALVFRKLRRKLGGRMKVIISGGAPLAMKTADFFQLAGIPVVEGYGTTETSPVIAVNPPGAAKIGTVGPPLDGISVRFVKDGELLTRGPHVMAGYYNDPVATAEATRDGWLHTGDLGHSDEDGYITITGRKKELIVTAYGKNIPYLALEASLNQCSLIRAAFVVGDGRKFVSALIVPDNEGLALAAAECHLQGLPVCDLVTAPELLRRYRAQIDAAQVSFAPFEQVKGFLFLPEEVLTDPEIVTPTQKIRRARLCERFEAEIDALYSSAATERVASAKV